MPRRTVRPALLLLAGALLASLVPAGSASAAAKAQSVNMGEDFACALTASGGVKCWGYNSNGAVGDGTNTDRVLPTQVKGLKEGVKQVEAGEYHACALKKDGTLWCWGYNGSGQLGDGTKTNRSVPVKVIGIGKVASMSVGDEHMCAITVAGAAKCWGYNAFGQLGDGTKTDRYTPVQVEGLKQGVRSISAGYDGFTCAINAARKALCWGYNTYGTLGDGTQTGRVTPTRVVKLGKVSILEAGYYHSCAVTTKGAAKCWGARYYGQLGDGTYSGRALDPDYAFAPSQVVGLTSGVTDIDPNYYFTCAVHRGAAKCWGLGEYGRLGNGSTLNFAAPTQVKGLNKGVTQISTGSYAGCARLSSGVAKCWGYNDYGELGDGTKTERHTPVKVRL